MRRHTKSIDQAKSRTDTRFEKVMGNDLQDYLRQGGRDYIRIEISVKNESDIAKLTSKFGEYPVGGYEGHYGTVVQYVVPAGAAEVIAREPYVNFVRSPVKPVGVPQTGVDIVHEYRQPKEVHPGWDPTRRDKSVFGIDKRKKYPSLHTPVGVTFPLHLPEALPDRYQHRQQLPVPSIRKPSLDFSNVKFPHYSKPVRSITPPRPPSWQQHVDRKQKVEAGLAAMPIMKVKGRMQPKPERDYGMPIRTTQVRKPRK